MEATVWLGIGGDFLTLAGGVMLAWDAINKEREHRRQQALVALIGSNPKGSLIIEVDGETLTGPEAIVRLANRHTARQAIVGAWLLVAGFLALLASHCLEAWNHAHLPPA